MHAVLYYDIQRASISLTRPSFDLEQWESAHLWETWDEILGAQQKLAYFKYPRPLDSSLKDIKLRTIFTKIRQQLEIAWLIASYPVLATDFFIAHLSSRILVCEGGLVNHFLDAGEQCPKYSSATPSETSASLQMSTSLAGLYWVRRAARHEGLGVASKLSKTGLYNAGPVILQHLKYALVKRDQEEASGEIDVDHSDSAGESRLRLWVLYIGVIAERASWSCGWPSKAFHNANFVQLAKDMGYTSWPGVCEVLKGFLYEESVDPDASKWFEQAMRATAVGGDDQNPAYHGRAVIAF